MKISLQWLKRYLELDLSAREIEDALTLIGFEVEGIEEMGLSPLDKVKVGEIVNIDQHPKADRLSVCEVNVGGEGGNRQIVCGATNMKNGDRVAIALPGAELPGGIKIKKIKIAWNNIQGNDVQPERVGLR